MLLRSLIGVSFALLSVGGTSTAWSQGGSWIDPPAQIPPRTSPPSERGVVPTPSTPPPSQARPQPPAAARRLHDRAPQTRAAEPRAAPERRGPAAKVEAAEALATEYLDTWSAPNGPALESTTAIYAPQVRFHGRVMSARALLEEKRRFVRRWPERSYRPRLATMGTACAPNGRTCTVRSIFDFAAADPASGRRSEGIGTIELVVSFAGERPVIAAENSSVLGRLRGEQRSALEEDGDE